MGIPVEPSDAGGAVVGTATPGAPASTVEPEPSVLERARTALAGTPARQAVGGALVVGWVVWLAALWTTQPRLVAQDFLADDLAQGRITGYQVVTVDEDRARGPLAGPYRLDVYPASDGQDGVVDGASDDTPVTIAYWVDAPVAGLRVLDTNGLSSETPAALAGNLRSAEVPEVDAGLLVGGTPAERVHNAGALLLLVSTLVVILGPRPRRGTRWFWFWLIGGPLAVAVPVFAVAELLRPRYEPAGTVHPPGVAGRWSGFAGYLVALAFSFAAGWGLTALTEISPIWFIRG
jgi:hypothetical protein